MERGAYFVALIVALVVVAAVFAWSVYRVSVRREFVNVAPRPLVLVVGAGLAGLTAAVSLAPHATVVVAEQSAHVGGNSARAKSGMCRPTRDSPEKRSQMLHDLLKVARTRDKERAERLVDEATAAHDWVREVLRVDLTEVNQTGGHSEPRTYSTASSPVGATLVEQALSTAREMGVTVCTDSRLVDLNHHPDGDGIVAVFEDNRQQRCDAVVIATGGYAHPKSEIIRTVAPHLASLPTTNGNTSERGGDTQTLLKRRFGARLQDLDRVQVHPTALVDQSDPENPHKELLAEAVRGLRGATLVDENGHRFVDELLPRDELVAAMQATGSQKFFVLVPREHGTSPFVKRLLERGLFRAARDSEQLHQQLGDVLVAEVTPALHYSMGGVSVDVDGRVLAEGGEPVRGVYAAGEVTGGLHGRNRLAGNSLLECVVYGRVVARTIIKDSEGSEAMGFDVTLCAPHTAPVTLGELLRREEGGKGLLNRIVGKEELARHRTPIVGLWLAIGGVVYDVTRYVDRHPHGAGSIVAVGGQDATDAFKMHHHGGDTYLADAISNGSVSVIGRYDKEQ